MTTTTEQPPALDGSFEIVPAEIGLDLAAKNSLELAFSGFFQQAAKWKKQAAAITDPKLARTARLELKNLRVAAEKKRKELKEDSLRMGKAIDGANNVFLALVVPIEKSLEDIEKAEERRIAEELRQRTEVRVAELRPFVDPALPMPAVGGMTEDQFQATLADAKLLHDMKLEAARKAEEERLEREAEAARERVRIAEENERLRKEAAEREAQLKAEREAAEAERRRIEEEARKQREEAEAKAKAERDKLEAAARAEREKAEAAAAAERKKREKIEAEAAALRREAEEKRKAEEKRQADELAAKAAAAKAPDREKLIAFAATVRALSPGEMATAAGNQVVGEIADQVAKFAAWIEKKAATL